MPLDKGLEISDRKLSVLVLRWLFRGPSFYEYPKSRKIKIKKKTNQNYSHSNDYCAHILFVVLPLYFVLISKLIYLKVQFEMLLHNVKQHNVNVTWRNVTKRSCTQRKSFKREVFKTKTSHNVQRHKTDTVTKRFVTLVKCALNILWRCTLCDVFVLKTLRFETLALCAACVTLLHFVCLHCVQQR